MKEYDLKINDENLKRSIEKDLLNRNKKLDKLIELLNKISGNKIISVDGKWGCGKTFFLKQLELINKSDSILNGNFTEENVKTFHEKYNVFYYNAWENDMHDSPILSLIYNLINDYPEESSRNASGSVEIPLNIIDCLKTISYNLIDLEKIKSYRDLTEEIHTSEEKKDALNNIINNILPNNKNLVFIIDELDRCKPDYALKMLEVIKHFYMNDRIIFLLGTNNLQLSYMISNYYGNNFDGYGYLNKIYDLVIELGNISVKDYIQNVLEIKNLSEWNEIVIYCVCEHFNFSMREINRFLNDFNFLEEYMNTNYGGFYSDDSVVKYLFLPYCLGLKIINGFELSKFFAGEGYSLLKKFIFKNDKLIKILKYCFNSENRNNEIKEDLNQLVEIEKYLNEKYNTYFLNEITEWQVEQNKKKFLDIFSLLSGYNNITM